MQHEFSQNKQSGVAILLAVMIMSGITIITTTVAYFVIQEIRLNRSATLTEPAIIAAETAGEQGLFRVKREASYNPSCSTSYTQLDGQTVGGAANIRIKTCIGSDSESIFQFTKTDPLVLYLYDPRDINGNLCMEDTCNPPADTTGSGQGLQVFPGLIVEFVSGGFAIDLDMDSLDGGYHFDGTVVPTPGLAQNFPIARDLAGAVDERLKITLTPTAKDATIKIRMMAGGLYQGLPDYQVLDAEGCVGFGIIANCDTPTETYSRRINITLPK